MTQSVGKKILEKSRPIEFKRSMGLFGATSLGIGSLMGAGLYVLVGIAAKESGPGLFIAYAACGVLTLFSVGMYADLAKHMPTSGGGYLYAYQQLGSFWGFTVGWHLALGSIFACALYAYGFGAYLVPFFGFDTEAGSAIRGIAIAMVVLLVLASLRGGKGGSRLQNLFTWGNLTVVLFLIAIALFGFRAKHLTPLLPKGLIGIGDAVSLVYLSFFGYQLIANAAEEVERPERNVPRAMLFSLLTAFVLYVAVALVSVGAVWWTDLAGSPAPLVLVATRAIGPAGGFVIGVGALLASVAALNGTLISQARQIFAMGRDRFIPPLLGSLSEKTRLPTTALLAGGMVTITVLVFADLAFIAKAANFSLLFSMLPLSFALHTLNKERRRKDEPVSSFKRTLPFWALAANTGLLLTLDFESLMFGGTVVAVGCVVFITYSASAAKRGQAGFSVNLGDEKAFPLLSRGERILVPMANPKTQSLLLELAESFLEPEKGEILVLNIVPMREGQKPRDALIRQSQVLNAVNVLTKAGEVAEAQHVAFTPIVRASRDLAEGIVDAATEEHAKLVIMGWSQNDEAMASQLLDEVAERWRGNLIFFHNTPPDNPDGASDRQHYRSIGVALGSHVNLALMSRVANALSTSRDSRVIYFNVLPAYCDVSDMRHAREIQIEAIQKHHSLVPYATEILPSENPLDTIVKRSATLDLLIIGTASSGSAWSKGIGGFTSMVARDARCPIIVVRQESKKLPPIIRETNTTSS